MNEQITFNRKTENTFAKKGRVHFNLPNRKTYFDMEAVAMTGAKPHRFVHFIQIGETWYVMVNDDKEGYMFVNVAERGGLRVHNAKFIRWFFLQNKIKGDKVFYMVVKTKIEWQGSTLFELQKMVE